MGYFRVSLFVLALSLPTSGTKGSEDLTAVGVAKVDITPAYPVRMSGYEGRTKPADSVDSRLWAKAIAIGDDAEKPAVLVTVDNLGVSDAMVEEVAERLRMEGGLERARFTVASSHTHSAPCLKGVAPHIFGKPIIAEEQEAIDRYTRELTDRLELVCLEALKNRLPGRLSWAQGKAGFAFNRRTKGGPVDHALPVLKVTDADGSLRAILINYACHCTTVDPRFNKFDGDWAGYAQTEIEADHPGVIALTSIGCGADSNPIKKGEGTIEIAKGHGREVADEVKRLLDGEWKALSGAPSASFKRLTLPFDTLPTKTELEAMIAKKGAIAYNASVQLAKLERGEPLQANLDYSVQTWCFGDDLAMIFLPGEVVVDYVLRLKTEYDASRLWVTAYANDDPCYIPSERILKEGGYEGVGAMMYYARPTRLKTGVEKLIIDAVREVMPKDFEAAKKSAQP